MMDHPHYAYSPLPERVASLWPQGSHVAAYVVLFLEHWDFVSPPGARRDPRMVGEFGSFSPDYRSWTQREYGLRIGIFRVIEALQACGIRPCIAANAEAVKRLPRLVERFNDWGCEWLAHGVAATQMLHSAMSGAEQEQYINESIATIEACCGHRPSGWLGQDWGSTPDTWKMLADAGMAFTLDWPNDDQPYWLQTTPPLLSIPHSAEWDDVQCQWLRNIEPDDHTRLSLSALSTIHAECVAGARGAVFGLSVHPWLSGMPSRIRAFRELLAGARQQQGLWWTTPGAIHAHVVSTR